MKLRVGVIGGGAIAEVHCAIVKKYPGVTLTAVHDVDATRAQSFAATFGMRAVEHLDEFWDQVDVVYITAPNRFHGQLAISALGRQKHVFCEKPFALSLEEAHAIKAAASASRSIYQLGFNRRCAPAYRKIKELISAPSFNPSSFNIKMNRGELQKPAWTSDAKVTGGFLFESTLHLLDSVRYLFGDIAEVKAIGSKAFYPCVDNFSLLFQMTNGVHGVFSSCAHTTWSYPFERVEVHGHHATVFNDEMEAVTYCTGLDIAVTTLKFATLSLAERWGYTLENKIFFDRITQADVPAHLYADADDGLANVALIEGIYEQIGLGR